jgi:hypothetical protein
MSSTDGRHARLVLGVLGAIAGALGARNLLRRRRT